jgi:GNAT superfamily N-acetyltransferase
LGLPSPADFYADRDYVRTRYLADPSTALGAEVERALIGSNFVANWGSVGFFGPLTVRPDYWDHGIGKGLLEPTMEIFDRRERSTQDSSRLRTVRNMLGFTRNLISGRGFSPRSC